VFCGGRWYDEQKNAELLARTITKVVAQQGDLQFVIAGKGSKEIFGDLAAQFPDRVLLPGVVPASEMLPLLNSCRFLLSSSRWESHPIGALEAVCSGCTVVATPIPGFLDIADGGRSGTIAESHRAEALARATLVENAKWESGERNPLQIAEHWRKIVNNRVVAGGMLQAALAGMGKSTANRDAQVI
jgi:glycosyltransferase involved in cell wall biosynthesis